LARHDGAAYLWRHLAWVLDDQWVQVEFCEAEGQAHCIEAQHPHAPNNLQGHQKMPCRVDVMHA
jgi:hypothetical protein